MPDTKKLKKPDLKKARRQEAAAEGELWRRYAGISLACGIISFVTPYAGIAIALMGVLMGVLSMRKLKKARVRSIFPTISTAISAFSAVMWIPILLGVWG